MAQGHAWDASSAADRGLGSQLRAALGRIHQHGIVQNDVKPDNIIVERATGRPLFVDFALARPTLDPEEYVSEDSELHAMLAQADPGWLVWPFQSVLLGRMFLTRHLQSGHIHACAMWLMHKQAPCTDGQFSGIWRLLLQLGSDLGAFLGSDEQRAHAFGLHPASRKSDFNARQVRQIHNASYLCMLVTSLPALLQPKVVAGRKAWTAREAYAVQGNIHAAATSQVPGRICPKPSYLMPLIDVVGKASRLNMVARTCDSSGWCCW